MNEAKAALRREMLAKRNSLSAETVREASDRLTRMLLALPEWENAESIYVYLTCGSEIITDGIVSAALRQGKVVAAPVCVGKNMIFRRIGENTGFTLNSHGIREPADSAETACDVHALVILPGLAFSRDGRRLGYGGGFYDRFLAAETEHPTAALCFDFQLLDTVPQDENDVPADIVLSTAV